MKPVVRPYSDRAQLEQALVAALKPLVTPGGPDNRGESDADSASFAVMLSGGSTPIPAYRTLATQTSSSRPGLHILFSDDRYVPVTSDASNYFQTRPLIEALKLDEQHLLRVRTELPLREAVADYAQQVAGLAERRVPMPLALVGLGADGHTCSLFSKADLGRARDADAIAVVRPDGRNAVSVTPRVLERADLVVFVVSGADKQTAVRALVNQDPAQTAWSAVSRCRRVEVWGDGAALGNL